MGMKVVRFMDFPVSDVYAFMSMFVPSRFLKDDDSCGVLPLLIRRRCLMVLRHT